MKCKLPYHIEGSPVIILPLAKEDDPICSDCRASGGTEEMIKEQEGL